MTWTLLLTAALSAAAPVDPAGVASALAATPDFAALATADLSFTPRAAASDAPSLSLQEHSSPGEAAQSPSPISAQTQPQPASLPGTSFAPENRFFKRDAWRWQITGAGATQFDDHFALAGVAVSYFIDYDFTIDFELNALYFVQDEGENTPGVNLAMQLRWHFCHDKSHGDNPHWTVYADAGFGVLLTAENVPAGGKQFNLTPQFGAGFSYLLDEATDMRLLAGIRWHHTSNANTHENNPGANKLMLYAGLNFPF
jgi:hypothetical protein